MEESSRQKRIDRSDIKLGIVCPMANEERTAVRLVHDVLDQCDGFGDVCFFAILDHACKDSTLELLKNMSRDVRQLHVIFAPENECVVDAYIKGYKSALYDNCQWILEMDAGYSHKPQELPEFFEKMEDGYDCVFGSRFCQGGKFTNAPLSRKMISKGGTFLANTLLGTKLKDMTSGFEMFNRDALEHVLKMGIESRGHFFQTEIKAFCRKFNVVEVPIHYSQPSAGVNSKVLADSFKNLWRLFKMRMSGKL